MTRKIGFFETFGTNITLFLVRHYWSEHYKSEIVCRKSWRFSDLRIGLIFKNKSGVGSDREKKVSLCLPKFRFVLNLFSRSRFFVKLSFVKAGCLRNMWKLVADKSFWITKP